MLFGSALKVPGGVGSYPLSSLAPTPVEVELGCDNTENQLPRLPGSALKVPGGVGSYPSSSQAPTNVEVELFCDN